MKKVIIVHGWSGSPKEPTHIYLKNELENLGFQVTVPEMPNKNHPEIESWVNHLLSICPNPDKDTHFIGHSIGCQTILRYLEKLNSRSKVGKIVLLAPWFHLQNLEGPESEAIAKPWIEKGMNIEKINKHISEITCIFSDNDLWVPLSDKDIFQKLFNAKISIQHNKGHFTEDDGVLEVPEILDEYRLK